MTSFDILEIGRKARIEALLARSRKGLLAAELLEYVRDMEALQTPEQAAVSKVLRAEERAGNYDGLKVSALAAKLGQDKTKVSAILKEMRRMGLVTLTAWNTWA